MPTFIVFGGSSVIVISVVQAIRSFSNGKIIVLGDHDTQQLRWSRLYQQHINISLTGTDDEKCVHILNKLAIHTPHCLLIPCDCDAVRMTNRIRSQIDIEITPIPDSESLDMFDDKWHFYGFCLRNALPMPTTIYIGSKKEFSFDYIVTQVGLPFMLKPSNKAGSEGIELICSKEDFDSLVFDNDDYVYEQLIAQRYIEGIDIDISLYAIKGNLLAFAIQKSDGVKISFVKNPELTSLAEEICEKSAYHGVMHVDARIELASGKVFLIESNPRFWASLTAAALCGLNFIEEVSIHPSNRKKLRQLSSGTVSTRSPLIQPSIWGTLLFDTCSRGRMVRAMAFDLPAMRIFIKSLLKIFGFYIRRISKSTQ
jgi:predicted ATP-grasp superfamily ATP-dependent carboligase